MSILTLEGGHDARSLKIAVIASRFNEKITARLLDGTLSALKSQGLEDRNLMVVRVPGALEIPVAAAELLNVGGVDAIICLGAVIKGETAHFDYVCEGALTGIAELSRTYRVPLTNGIITAYTEEQAIERSGANDSNIGAHAASAAIEMALLLRKIESEP